MFDKVNAVPKPVHKRRVPKRGARAEFPQSVKKQVYEEQGGLCELCGFRRITEFHHVRKRTQSGRGIRTNCSGLCHECHRKVTDRRDLQIYLEKKYEKKYGKDYYKDQWD